MFLCNSVFLQTQNKKKGELVAVEVFAVCLLLTEIGYEIMVSCSGYLPPFLPFVKPRFLMHFYTCNFTSIISGLQTIQGYCKFVLS